MNTCYRHKKWTTVCVDVLRLSQQLFSHVGTIFCLPGLNQYKADSQVTCTGQPRYVKLAYLEYTAYVEVIIHSRAFPLYCLYFKPVYVELGYHEISAI